VKDGKNKKVCLTLDKFPYDEMAGMTGIPLAIATMMLIEGKITKNGVLTPEESIDPIEFFDRLAPYCDKENAEDLLIWEISDI
jgi:saccharopine dehydrogenase-like NADP-dependent oxidoreductase